MTVLDWVIAAIIVLEFAMGAWAGWWTWGREVLRLEHALMRAEMKADNLDAQRQFWMKKAGN